MRRCWAVLTSEVPNNVALDLKGTGPLNGVAPLHIAGWAGKCPLGCPMARKLRVTAQPTGHWTPGNTPREPLPPSASTSFLAEPDPVR